MEDRIELSLTEAAACEVALDEVLEDLRASGKRRKEGLSAREVALEFMLTATRRSIGAKRRAASRDLPWRVPIAAEAGDARAPVETRERWSRGPDDALPLLSASPGEEPPDDPTAHEQGKEEF